MLKSTLLLRYCSINPIFVSRSGFLCYHIIFYAGITQWKESKWRAVAGNLCRKMKTGMVLFHQDRHPRFSFVVLRGRVTAFLSSFDQKQYDGGRCGS